MQLQHLAAGSTERLSYVHNVTAHLSCGPDAGLCHLAGSGTLQAKTPMSLVALALMHMYQPPNPLHHGICWSASAGCMQQPHQPANIEAVLQNSAYAQSPHSELQGTAASLRLVLLPLSLCHHLVLQYATMSCVANVQYESCTLPPCTTPSHLCAPSS